MLHPLNQESIFGETYFAVLQLRVVIRVAHQGIATEVISDVDGLPSADPHQTMRDIMNGVTVGEVDVAASPTLEDLFDSFFQAHSDLPGLGQLTPATLQGLISRLAT